MSAKVMEAAIDQAIRNALEQHCPSGKWSTGPNTFVMAATIGVMDVIEAADQARGGEAVARVSRHSLNGLTWTDHGQAQQLPHDTMLYTNPADGVDLRIFRDAVLSYRQTLMEWLSSDEAVCNGITYRSKHDALIECDRLLSIIQHSKGRSNG